MSGIHIDFVAYFVFRMRLSPLLPVLGFFLLNPNQRILKPFPHVLDSLGNLVCLFYFGSPSSFICAWGFQPGSWVITLVSKERRDSDRLVDEVVSHKFCIGEIIHPIILEVIYVVPQVPLQKPVRDFGLAVGFWMLGR